MRLPQILRQWQQSRRFLTALDRIAKAQEQQNLLLQRLCDHFLPPTTVEADLATTGVSYSDSVEQGRILEFADRFYAAHGRPPDEEEIMRWLEDEATEAQVPPPMRVS